MRFINAGHPTKHWRTTVAFKNFSVSAGNQALLLGGVTASAMLFALLWSYKGAGLPSPAKLVPSQFQVAVMAGEKRAAQDAPEDAQQVTEQTIDSTSSSAAEIKVQENNSQLPEAVAAAPFAESSLEKADMQQDEVIPPAVIRMPGGTLASEDIPVKGGSSTDPLAIGNRQVYIRLFVNEKGIPVRGGIVRSGPEPYRDALLLKVAKSRVYETSRLLPAADLSGSGEPQWQVDLVLEYDSASVLP